MFIQDRTVLSYLAYVLEVPDPEVVQLALSILEIFTRNVENYVHVTSTFGVREALDAVINKYSVKDVQIAEHAQTIKNDIERMKPPIYNLRSRCRRVIEPKKLKTHVVVLHVSGLLPVSPKYFCYSLHAGNKKLLFSLSPGNESGSRSDTHKNRRINFPGG